MFGIIRGCGCHLNSEARRSWLGHICGLCLALRDYHGQLSRVATNYDAALLSVLCEAQSLEGPACVNHNCPLRRFRRMDVVRPAGRGTQFAASVSMLMAATKIQDRIADGDGWWPYFRSPAAHLARRYWQTGAAAAARLGFDSQLIEQQVGLQRNVEQQQGRAFTFYSQPTELAAAAAFGHTAVIAGQPINQDPLARLGSAFGRIMVLLDAYQDYAADRAAGRFNALAASCNRREVQVWAQKLFREALLELKESFSQVALPNSDLARTLLVEQLPHHGRQILAQSSGSGEPLDQEEAEEEAAAEEEPQRQPSSVSWGHEFCYWMSWCPGDCDGCGCDCGDCDCNDCDCDCGDCDCGDCDCDC